MSFINTATTTLILHLMRINVTCTSCILWGVYEFYFILHDDHVELLIFRWAIDIYCVRMESALANA